MQSKWMSFVEAVTNIVVGYGLAVLTQIIVFPLFGLYVSLGENFLLAALFTCDPPPLKWSDLKYVLWHQGGSEHAKEEAHA
jgi:hypothetical protein